MTTPECWQGQSDSLIAYDVIIKASTHTTSSMAVDNNREIVVRAASSLGYSLKPEQEQAILAFVSGNDVFIAVPTGYGKSLCFGVLPRAFDLKRGVQSQSLVMVVSPLVALMRDQAASFASKGVTAACISDKDDHHSTKLTRRGIKRGDFQLIFVSPEALFATLEWRKMLCNDVYRTNLVAFVVDEAHCVKKW